MVTPYANGRDQANASNDHSRGAGHSQIKMPAAATSAILHSQKEVQNGSRDHGAMSAAKYGSRTNSAGGWLQPASLSSISRTGAAEYKAGVPTSSPLA